MRMHHLFSRFAEHHRELHHRHGFDMPESFDRKAIGRHGGFGGRHDSDGFGNWNDRHGGGRRGGGRMFGHGDLKLLLLALIEQQPRHGYEMIRIIEDMFHGHYSPSPGAIYPTLTMLEEMGYAAVENESGSRKLYTITAEGRAFLDENRDAVDAVNERTEKSARMAARMAMPAAVHKAMHAIKHAMLMRGADWSKAEAQRVAAILEKAATEIASRGDE